MKLSTLIEILGVCISLMLVATSSIETSDWTIKDNNKIRIEGNLITLWLQKPNGGGLSVRRIKISNLTEERPIMTQHGNMFNATWRNGMTFTIHAESDANSKVYVYRTELQTPLRDSYLEQCEELGDHNWYGAGENIPQAWPMQNLSIPEEAFIPKDPNGGVLERYFLSSQGISFYVYESVPLFVTLDPINHTLCLRSEFKEPYRNTNNRDLVLPIYMVMGTNILDTHKYSSEKFFPRPLAIPEKKIFRDPIWSTWATYKVNISQEIVLNFSREIDSRGFPVSQIGVDDNWETCYGNEEFNPVTFPDPRAMVQNLNARGHVVALWVHPFVNVECKMYAEGDALKYFVTTHGNDVTGITSWWNSNRSAIIDVTNDNAARWWYQRLDKLRKNYGFEALKFDAGEASWLPSYAHLHGPEDKQTGSYSTTYAHFANQFGGRTETRVGYRSENVSIFTRMVDRHSTWGLDFGLHSLVTSTLHMGLIGSPFVLPDYVGGNAYDKDIPDRELFIRWVQLTAFLPVMQFSILPWSYDKEVEEISRRMVALHQNISDIIIAAAQQATVDGSPIIRPLWWISPNDATAQQVNDEFLVGDTYLVAPVIQKGATQRDVYLPVGNWSDQLRGGVIGGPTWLRNYKVELSEISYFLHLY